MTRAAGPPTTPVMHHPIEKGSLEADIMAGFFALDPLVTENFLPLRKKLAIQHRVLNEGPTLAMEALHR